MRTTCAEEDLAVPAVKSGTDEPDGTDPILDVGVYSSSFEVSTRVPEGVNVLNKRVKTGGAGEE